MESKDARKLALINWLNDDCGFVQPTLHKLVGDASFRRYFRLYDKASSYVVMDAPPQFENCKNYIAIAKALRDLGLRTPEIIIADAKRGFLLISDFGDETYLKILNQTNANDLYHNALQSLLVLQSCKHVQGMTLPNFTKACMWQEWHWHKEWFAHKLLGLDLRKLEKALDACFLTLAETAANQPKVFMHRDYHAANLMALPSAETGLLDFQDAFMGPITYDLVSLLRDCYIEWPVEMVLNWATAYFEILVKNGRLTNVSLATFLRWFDFMGIERHLKALFTFARKKCRDGEAQYLNHVTRTLHYLSQATIKYPELTALQCYINDLAKPAFLEIYRCEQ